jgi:hypothetical protein
MPELKTKPDVDRMPEDPSSATEAPVAAALATAQEEALNTMEAAGTAMFEGLTKAQKEISDFIAERIRQDVETQSALLRCRTFDDMRDVQARFLKTAMDQYAAEATRLIQIGAEMMAPASRPAG